MSLTLRDGARFLPASLLLIVLVSSTGLSVNPSVNAQVLPLQHNYLAFTVEPDRSVRVGWNTTTTLPASTVPMNISNVFPPGYAIHSASSFSQQSNAVVQTTTTQYVVPAAVIQQSQGLLNYINLVNLTNTQTGLSGVGSLSIDTTPSIILPVDNVLVSFNDDLTHVNVTASAQLYFYPSLSGNLSFLQSQSAFQSMWDATFGNYTGPNSWTNQMIGQIQNSTKVLRVTAFSGTITSIDSTSANVSIVFDAVPTITITPNDFISAFENTLGTTIPTQIDTIIRQALALTTSQTMSLTYTGSNKTVTLKSTTNYVANLDSQLNSIKNELFQFIFANAPVGTPIPPAVSFINSTSIAVSQMSTTSDLDLNASTVKSTMQGLILKPPTVGQNTNFTIPGLFQTLGSAPQSSLDITLIGGSNSSYTVKIVVPSGTVQPTSTTANSDTWTNIQNATALQGVRFELVATSSSLLAILTSPTALIIEGVAAVAVAAGVLLLMRRRRTGVTAPTPVMGPAPTPGPGPTPSPAPPTP